VCDHLLKTGHFQGHSDIMEIFEAAKAGKASEVEVLLYSISLSEVNKRYQHTALEVAAQHGQMGVVSLLIRRMMGANGVAGLDEGVALHLAAKHGQEAIVDILCDSGADLDSTALGHRTPLIWASSEGHVGVVQRLLYHMGGEGIDGKGGYHEKLTALHLAAANGHAEVVKLLLQRGADATIVNDWGAIPLSSACAGGHLGVVQLLLEHQGLQALGMTPSTRLTPLHHAARKGREDMVKFLLSKGADANSQREDGWTPFMEASSHGHVGVARMLLEHMEVQDIDSRDKYGQTALFHAAGGGHEDMVALLLSKGANATIQPDEGWGPPLEQAMAEGHVGVVRLLLEHMGSQDIDTRDDEGETALFHAAGKGHEDMVAFLLSKGANATIKSDEGVTPLMQASIEGRVGVARLLFEHMGGQGLTTQDNEGMTALHHAVSQGHDDMVSFLLAKGADPNITALDGRTALARACVNSDWSIVLLLAKHMGRHALETRDSEGRTPLYLACKQHDWGGARLLLLAGADHTTTDNQGHRPPGFDKNILPVSTLASCTWSCMLVRAHSVMHGPRTRQGHLDAPPWYVYSRPCFCTRVFNLAVVGGRAGASLPPSSGEGAAGRGYEAEPCPGPCTFFPGGSSGDRAGTASRGDCGHGASRRCGGKGEEEEEEGPCGGLAHAWGWRRGALGHAAACGDGA
jgi:ankyrin repeat protein